MDHLSRGGDEGLRMIWGESLEWRGREGRGCLAKTEERLWNQAAMGEELPPAAASEGAKARQRRSRAWLNRPRRRIFSGVG